MTVSEAAKIMKCTANNVRHLIRVGNLPAKRVKVRGLWQYKLKLRDVKKHKIQTGRGWRRGSKRT